MRALVVDDEFISRMVLESMLSSIFEVDSAENGRASLDAFEKAHAEGRPYEFVFMDIMMPVLDGMAALEIIRQREVERNLPQAKVVMATALSDVSTIKKCIEAGKASGYIVKPFNQDKLMEALKKFGIADV